MKQGRQLEHFDNIVQMFLTRAAEKGDAPFLWAKRDREWQSISWAEDDTVEGSQSRGVSVRDEGVSVGVSVHTDFWPDGSI